MTTCRKRGSRANLMEKHRFLSAKPNFRHLVWGEKAKPENQGPTSSLTYLKSQQPLFTAQPRGKKKKKEIKTDLLNPTSLWAYSWIQQFASIYAPNLRLSMLLICCFLSKCALTPCASLFRRGGGKGLLRLQQPGVEGAPSPGTTRDVVESLGSLMGFAP